MNDGKIKKLNPELLSVAKKLQDAGADFVAIPSNTPHLFYKEISSCVSIPVLNIVEEATKVVKEKKIKTAAIISAHPEIGNLYKKNLNGKNIDLVVSDDYSEITYMIEEFMAGRKRALAKKFFCGLMNELNKKAETTILACTELPLILGNDLNKYKFIDSLQVLAKTAVNYALIV